MAQIPSILYYDQYQKVVGWGTDIADALAPTGYPKPGIQKVEWFRMHLMRNASTAHINLPPLPPGKSEINVAADFLFKIRQTVRIQLRKNLGEVFHREEQRIQYCFTTDVQFDDRSKEAFLSAIIQAGFIQYKNFNRVTFISKPKAVALFFSKSGLLNLRVNDAVLIVDAGGGTVDCIAYFVEDETSFIITEATVPSGDSCGSVCSSFQGFKLIRARSTATDRNFSNIVRAKIAKTKLPKGSKIAGRVYAKCIKDFNNRIREDFRNNGQKWAVDVGIEAEFPEADIEEGYMTFTNEDILTCFEPVVNRVLEIIRNQIIAVQTANKVLQVS
jgi:hypothetical protein